MYRPRRTVQSTRVRSMTAILSFSRAAHSPRAYRAQRARSTPGALGRSSCALLALLAGCSSTPAETASDQDAGKTGGDASTTSPGPAGDANGGGDGSGGGGDANGNGSSDATVAQFDGPSVDANAALPGSTRRGRGLSSLQPGRLPRHGSEAPVPDVPVGARGRGVVPGPGRRLQDRPDRLRWDRSRELEHRLPARLPRRRCLPRRAQRALHGSGQRRSRHRRSGHRRGRRPRPLRAAPFQRALLPTEAQRDELDVDRRPCSRASRRT